MAELPLTGPLTAEQMRSRREARARTSAGRSTDDLERDVAFLAQMIRDEENAEPSELARLDEIARRYPRFAAGTDCQPLVVAAGAHNHDAIGLYAGCPTCDAVANPFAEEVEPGLGEQTGPAPE